MSAADAKSKPEVVDAKFNVTDPLQSVRIELASIIVEVVKTSYGVDLSDLKDEIHAKGLGKLEGEGRLAFPTFVVSKRLKKMKPDEQNAVAQELAKAIGATAGIEKLLERVVAEKHFVNMFLSTAVLARVIPVSLDGSFLQPRAGDGKDRVMIEYSQPNTHKAFHVGHMRNAALGDSLVRLYKAAGHNVVAANYFGDEGAHIAKCLWYLKRHVAETKLDLATLAVDARGEFLGEMYSKAVDQLDLGTFTKYPFPGVIGAKVLSVGEHPAKDAPANWRRVILQVHPTDATKTAEVICGGTGFAVGDIVAYLPVGAKLKGNFVEPKDMKGVTSCGVMMSDKELEKDKIMILPADTPIGVSLVEVGRFPNTSIPVGTLVEPELVKRNKEVDALLLAMERQEGEIRKLWAETKAWSLAEFQKIYKWLDCRFDHDFFESEVGEESKQMVAEFHKKGVLKNSGGALVADLSEHKLGVCVLLKSNGAGLYATKDLALARRKFDKFKIDKSIYVVDAAQTLHFQQVFKTLELFGYEKAKKCLHLPYGLVVLPSGKMSSRKGTVILFSQLVKMLGDQIDREYLSKLSGNSPVESTLVGLTKLQGTVSDAELVCIRHAVSVATIKFGMLNHDRMTDIVFKMDEWTARGGMNGPYMMYAYARTRALVAKVTADPNAKVDLSLLSHKRERSLLALMHNLWPTVASCLAKNNASGMCEYVYDLAKAYSLWYDNDDCSVKNTTNKNLQATRLALVNAFAAVLKFGLHLLGINTVERM